MAKLDVFTSLAYVADKNHYVRPKINAKGVIDIQGGRHPVVEKMISNDMFISPMILIWIIGVQPDLHYYRTEHGR